MPASSNLHTNALLIEAARPALATRPLFQNGEPDFEIDACQTKTRLWDLHASLHCSIIGTCLTTIELRQILKKTGLSGIEDSSDHDLHSIAVGLCCKQQTAPKLLQKALDRKHLNVIRGFSRAEGRDGVRSLWRGYADQGDVQGAYWAVLTHPLADEALVRQAFGDVHMLSHLVGASNRADIRRLCELEKENAALNAKAQLEEARLREAIYERDETIRSLRTTLAEAQVRRAIALEGGRKGSAACDKTSPDSGRNLDRQAEHISRLEGRLETVTGELALSKKEAFDWRGRSLELENELNAIDECLVGHTDPARDAENDLSGKTLLYVGGRPNQVPQLKKLASDFGADFLHHDGGVDDNAHSLAALAVRADAVLFPVECVSHSAALTVKRVCRQLGKAYYPLRSSGLTSFAGCLLRLKLAPG